MFKFSPKIIVALVSAFLITFAGLNFNNSINQEKVIQIDFSDFVNETENNNVHDVLITGRNIVGHLNNGAMFKTIIPFQDHNLVSRLISHKVRIKAVIPEDSLSSLIRLILSWLSMILFIGVCIFSLKQMSKAGARSIGLTKAKSKKNGEKEKTTFKDVAGADEAKKELEEIIDFLKNPKKFQTLGGRMPKGVLLFGPPGTGKTLLARAVAGEAKCAFFYASASEFVEMFVGVGASRVRDLFEKAKQTLPAIIFIDEFDAMGKQRGVGSGGGNDEREQTLNEFLVQLDGFTQNKGLIVFAATNRPDVLDKALIRSGRFDRQIYISNPDLNQREAILKVHAKKILLNKNVDLKIMAKSTPGFSGADLENLINESALLAAQLEKKEVELVDLEFARDKIVMGSKRAYLMRDEDKKLTAYHEAGHAILAHYSKYSDPIHKATIVPMGQALGMVVQFPEYDKVSITKIQLIERIRIAMAGRVAEELIFGKDHITSGARSDIKIATETAENMVLKYGMSEICGMRNYSENDQTQSQEFTKVIDQEINTILSEAYNYAKALLTEKIDELHKLANKLLEKETLDGSEITEILKTEESTEILKAENA